MRNIGLVLVAVVGLPAILVAQGQYPRSNPIFGQRQVTPQLRAKDLEALNPARIAIERRSDLALDVVKAGRLDSVARAFDAEAKGFAHVIDTLQKAMRPPRASAATDRAAGMTDPRPRPKSPKDSIDRARSDSVDRANLDRELERNQAARREFTSTLLRIRDSYDSYVATTLAVLSDEQRGKLGPWIQAASEELTARLHWINQR